MGRCTVFPGNSFLFAVCCRCPSLPLQLTKAAKIWEKKSIYPPISALSWVGICIHRWFGVKKGNSSWAQRCGSGERVGQGSKGSWGPQIRALAKASISNVQTPFSQGFVPLQAPRLCVNSHPVKSGFVPSLPLCPGAGACFASPWNYQTALKYTPANEDTGKNAIIVTVTH